MNKNLLYEAMANPEVLRGVALEELEQLRTDYPWFPAAQVLLAKAYQQHNDHRFTDQLHQAAVYSGDRVALRSYLLKESPAHAPGFPEVGIRESAAPEVHVALPTTIYSPETEEAATQAEVNPEQDIFFEVFGERTRQAQEEAIETSVQNADSERLAAAMLEEDEQLPTTVAPTAAPEALPDLPPLPDGFGATVISGTDEEEATGTIPDLRHMDLLEQNILVEAVSSTIEQEAAELTDEEAEDASHPEPSIKAEEEDLDEYTAWLLRRSRRSPSVPEAAVPPATPPSGIPKPAASDGPAHGLTRLPATDPKAHQRDLIDRFIRTEPKITPGKAADFGTSNLAKESLEDDFGLVTETMAKLFAAQGKLDKARKVYRILMEQHPEKSVYFAALLKNLNQNKKG